MEMQMQMNRSYRIETDQSDPTLAFAAQELERCIGQLSPQAGGGCIRLQVEQQENHHPFGDEINIRIVQGSGHITGPNARSVLLGVYRYLRELGCRFLYPGKAGELFPEDVQLSQKTVILSEKPEHRYRGVMIEGANRLETLLDMIDFLPKLGMNCYFIQFKQAFVFFRRWYRHTSHPTNQLSEPYPVREAEEKMAVAVAQIKKRGLVYHAVGHGWTCDPFGVPGLEWDPWQGEVPEQARQYFAQVGGVRALWKGVPLNTNLCWSNPQCREIVTDAICEYAQTHPETDMLHVWLSDGSNNQCECPECVKRLPSDWYVMLLNEIDRKLAAKKLDTKICFIIYSDLLWAPETERLENPDRFLMLFAPISRTYRKPFSPERTGTTAPYRRNAIVMPESVGDNLAYLRTWQAQFAGDGMILDYHYMWAHHRDAGGLAIARVLYEDIHNLKRMGLNGYMSCQVQRAMFPNALGITVMARALWGSESFEEITQEYFQSLYGQEADRVRGYLQTLSKLTHEMDLEHPRDCGPEKAELCKALLAATKDMLDSPVTGANLPVANRYLQLHAKLWHQLAQALLCLELEQRENAVRHWKTARKLLWDMEPHAEMGLDCFNFDRTFKDIVGEEILAIY